MKEFFSKIKTNILSTQFITFYGFRMRKIFTIIIKYYIPVTSVFILLFAIIFHQIGGLEFIYHKNNIVTLLDCFYFSAISFFSIGYGDIIPKTNVTKLLAVLLDFLSFIMLTLYSGFIIPIFFVRRNDVSFHDQLYICYNDETFTLSFPVLNKGSLFYEMQGVLSLTLCNKRNIVSRYGMITVYTTWFKEIWCCDFEITKENSNDKDYMIIYETLYLAISKQINRVTLPKLKLCIHGIDSQTREVGYFIKEFYLNGMVLSFSNNSYEIVYDKQQVRTSYKKTFPLMEDLEFMKFLILLEEIIFPEKENNKMSLTGLFEMENKRLSESWENYPKEFTIS